MRAIKYERMPPVGPGPNIRAKGTLVQFLQDIPYFLRPPLIPPLEVLNDVFAKGIKDAGMSGGCKWEPFQISEADWDELVDDLESLSEKRYEWIAPPEWVKTTADWHIWGMEYRVGIPSEKHRALSQEYNRWAEMSREAASKGDKNLQLEYHVKAIEAVRH